MIPVPHAFFGKQGVSEDFVDPVFAKQVHGTECLYITSPFPSDSPRPEADAMITDVPGLPLGVVTADCAPVLFYGEKDDGQPVVGVAHAGWRGALSGVLENTVAALERLGTEKDTICAAIGPCIGPDSYEVLADFIVPFRAQDAGHDMFFKPALREGHFMFDLPGYVSHRLKLSGVTGVSFVNRDTYAEEEAYYSFRRSTHNNEPDDGRQVSAIYVG